MKGDFTRDSFDSRKHFTRVLQQQGRVQIDADWNEQVSIFWDHWRSFAQDLIGPHGGPEARCGFGILPASEIDSLFQNDIDAANALKSLLKNDDDFLIGPGHYYVDGLLCKNPTYVSCATQPDLHHPGLRSSAKHPFLIYLDVWERHISVAEDDSIREVALGGADTASRAKLIWQVKHFELTEPEMQNALALKANWEVVRDHFQPPNRGRLRAKSKETAEGDLEPCTTSPQSRYRGPENQLYRVEIHRGGPAGSAGKVGATFKWSRENGSVIFPIVAPVSGASVTLANPGRDARSELEIGDWVEILDDDYVLGNRSDPLLRVEQIPGSTQVILSAEPASKVGQNPLKHPYLRRWDQREQKIADPRKAGLELQDGAVAIREGDGEKAWILLEDGVQIQFNPSDPHNHYRTGDYWMIPARTATGDVMWPQSEGKPVALGPRGVKHHYAPLAILEFQGGVLSVKGQCRMKFSLPTLLLSDSGF